MSRFLNTSVAYDEPPAAPDNVAVMFRYRVMQPGAVAGCAGAGLTAWVAGDWGAAADGETVTEALLAGEAGAGPAGTDELLAEQAHSVKPRAASRVSAKGFMTGPSGQVGRLPVRVVSSPETNRFLRVTYEIGEDASGADQSRAPRR